MLNKPLQSRLNHMERIKQLADDFLETQRIDIATTIRDLAQEVVWDIVIYGKPEESKTGVKDGAVRDE